MLNFVVCDDNPNILDKFSKMLNSIFIKHDFEAQISCRTTNPNELLDFILSKPVDVLFLDINLKSDISGLDIAKKLRERNKNTYIIFTTGHLEYAMMAYKLKTFDYLPKPITIERLEETVIRLFDDIEDTPKKYIKVGNKHTIINQDNICYIKKNGMKLVFVTPTKKYEAYSSFNKLQNDLPSNFVRCHKSFIANINKINDIHDNSIISFENNRTCAIGPKYKNNLMEVLNNGNT